MKLPHWSSVYPHGTKEGDEELKFFIALARNPKFKWRSTLALAEDSGLTRERVEEIITKYYKKGMIFQNPKNDEQWGYHGRVPDMIPGAKKSISGKDQYDRVNKVVSKDCIDCSPCLASDTSAYMQLKSGYVTNFKMDDNDRRVFYIDITNIPTTKAEKFMEKLKSKFKEKKDCNDSCPQVTDPSAPQQDVEYFRKHLVAALQLPVEVVQKLEELKLEVMAKNPMILGVPVA